MVLHVYRPSPSPKLDAEVPRAKFSAATERVGGGEGGYGSTTTHLDGLLKIICVCVCIFKLRALVRVLQRYILWHALGRVLRRFRTAWQRLVTWQQVAQILLVEHLTGVL